MFAATNNDVYNGLNFWGERGGHSPTAEALTGAGEVLVGKEAAVSYKITWDLAIEALAQRLQRNQYKEKTLDLGV